MTDNVSLALKVTQDSSSQGGHKWEFNVGDGFHVITDVTTLFHVPDGTDANITVTIESGDPGSTCVFRSDPLSIDGEPVMVDLTDSSTFIFMDDNTALHPHPVNLGVKFFALFNNDSIASPDPTIVNDGTDHPGDDSSQERTQPAAAAV